MFLGTGLAMHPEELGEKIIRCSVVSRDLHEGQIGHILHWSKRSQWLPGDDAGRKRTGWSRVSAQADGFFATPGMAGKESLLAFLGILGALLFTATKAPG